MSEKKHYRTDMEITFDGIRAFLPGASGATFLPPDQADALARDLAAAAEACRVMQKF